MHALGVQVKRVGTGPRYRFQYYVPFLYQTRSIKSLLECSQVSDIFDGRDTTSRRVYMLCIDGVALMDMEGFDTIVSRLLMASVG